MRRTNVPGRPRSKELKALDEELKDYHKGGGGSAAMWRVQEALEAWKRAQGPGNAWVKSIRNRKGAVAQLTAQLAGEDSDAALGLVPQFMQDHVQNARLGVLYLLSRLRVQPDIFNVVLEGALAVIGGQLSFLGGKIVDGGLGNASADLAQHIFNAALVPGNVVLTSGCGAAQTAHLPHDRRQALLARIGQMFKEFIKKLVDALKEKFGSFELPITAIKNLVNTCTKICLDTLSAGLVGGAQDLFKGTVNLVDGVVQKVRAYIREKGVVISGGHPEVIVNSIKRAMTLSLLEGLWQAMKGGCSLGLAWATWGTAAVVTAVVACFEVIVKVVWRMVEVLKMDKLFEQAAEWWERREAANALHKQPVAFTDWFRKHALHLPAVSILVHNSGICGDKMVFLSMYDYTLKANEQPGDRQLEYLKQEFNKGVAYLEFLKSWGVKYLNKTGFSFYSKDDFVSELIDFATRPDAHAIPASRLTRFWEKIVVPVANA